MEYRKYGKDYVVRLQKGEEVLAGIQAVCEREHILLGSVSGIGAVGEVTLGVFNSEKFVYETEDYQGDFEISSCSGNISTMDGKTYLHIHAVMGNPTKNLCVGGHLSRAVISLTGEFMLHQIDGEVDRAYSPEVGLNLIRFID